MVTENQALKDRIANLHDRELVRMVTEDRDQYTDEALSMAKEEIGRRAINLPQEIGEAPGKPAGRRKLARKAGREILLKLVRGKANVYTEKRENATTISEINAGDFFQWVGTAREGGRRWLQVLLLDGKRGYLADTKTEMVSLRKVLLMQPTVSAYAAPSRTSSILASYLYGDGFYLSGLVAAEGEKWVEVFDLVGNHGYIPETTRVVKIDTTKMEFIHKWSSRFGKFAGLLAVAAGVLQVIANKPSPGKLLPMGWNWYVVVQTLLIVIAGSGIGVLVGIWRWKKRPTSGR